MQQDLLVQRLHVAEVSLGDLLDGDAHLRVEVPRRVHHAVRALAQHHALVEVIQLVLELQTYALYYRTPFIKVVEPC